MEKIFEAKTEQEAVEAAVREFGVNVDFLEVEILKKSKGRFLGRGEKVTIKASVLGLPVSDEHHPKPEPVSHNYTSEESVKEDISQDKKDEICAVVKNLVDKIGIEVHCDFDIQDNFYVVTMTSTLEEEQNLLIGKHGKNIESIQNICNSIIQNNMDDFPDYIVVDIEDYRTRRNEWLSSIARKKSHQVLQTGKSYLLDDLGPFDRKIIHNVVRTCDGVATISMGNGYHKRVKIYLD